MTTNRQLAQQKNFVIKVEDLTKDYGFNRGIFGVNLQVKKGTVYGFLGPNGAGKTTTIRHIIGFQKGKDVQKISINGINVWNNQNILFDHVGYLPGEINFPPKLTGKQYLDFISGLRNVRDDRCRAHLIKLFKLNTRQVIKEMSLGNKRKLAVVSAFMHNPDVYILDEPTSGLDPLMQEIFINYILGIKKQGKTVLLSTHIYHEVEALCDQVSIIKQGRIVSSIDMKEIKIRPQKIYKLEFLTKAGYDEFVSHKLNYQLKEPDKLQVRVIIEDNNINQFIRLLATTPIKFFSEDVYTLEDHFMHFYKKGDRS